ncbi:MAG: hypothetical protein ACRDF0_07610, partial [Candidatus Limnocylindria bacterium]
VIPVESGIQLASGAGHIAGAALGVAFLGPLLRGHSRRTWLAAHFAALVYWTAHVALLTPPWFAFQGQGEIVTLAALLALGLATVTNACVWVRSAAAG